MIPRPPFWGQVDDKTVPEAVAQEPEQVPGEAPEAALSTPPPPKEPGAQEEGSPGVGGGSRRG